jgi:adenylosuccinate synthase
MKHSTLINGYDSFNLTKLDVLDDLAEIQIGVKYVVNGKELAGFPADLEILDKVAVEYVTLPGWKSSITSITNYEDLPSNCKKYVEYIEEFLKVPVQWIGVGPGRESMIKK